MRQNLNPPPARSVEPIRAEEFKSVLETLQLRAHAPLALAVSGGPDSVALAICALRWAQTNNTKLIAFIVDHALRPQSGDEAAQTQKTLTQLGINSEILRWEHAPIVTRLHSTARKARYQLLTDACKKHGADTLMLAHQREDQAETILMRLAKGSGIDGLAGMAMKSESEGVHLLRPLLAFPKERLIATCENAKISFITDPSNMSDQFARGRLRRVLPFLEKEGFTADRLIDLGHRAAEARDALDHYAKIFIQQHAQQDVAGVIRIDLEAMISQPRAIIQRVMTSALQAIYAQDYAPEYTALNSLITTLLAPDAMPPRTLHGCLMSLTEKYIVIMREYAGITDAPILRPGETTLWDDRWNVTLSPEASAGDYIIRPLGNPPQNVIEKLAPGLTRMVPQGRARASLPSLWQGRTNAESLSFIPFLTQKNAAPLASVTLRRRFV
jgi:tRNA(Ile)-lysidine synthase